MQLENFKIHGENLKILKKLSVVEQYSLFREVCPLKQIYGKVIKIKGKCQKMKGEYQKCAFPPGKNNSIY
jgi:hypothetical protein